MCFQGLLISEFNVNFDLDKARNTYSIGMATKQQILEKIATLLAEINNQHQQLEKDAAQDNLAADLFEATVNYFAAHVSLYNKLVKKEAADKPDSSEREVFFTPPKDTYAEQATHETQLEEVQSEDD